MKKILYCLVFLSVFAVNIWADLEPGADTSGHIFKAPQNPGSALIIYCAKGYGYEFSQGAMETFRAALAQDMDLIQHPNKGTIDGYIPEINPPLTRVNVLDVTSVGVGIETQLRNKFYNKGSVKIDEFDFEGDIFDELYDAGNPLAYWSQVYDLRFVNNGAASAATITTDLSNSRSDISYFKEHLKAGGTLFLQDEYSVFTSRNNGVAAVITEFTQDKNHKVSNISAGSIMSTFKFDSTFEKFAYDFNDLAELEKNYRMTWVMAGGVDRSTIPASTPLVLNGNTTVIAAWGTTQMDPSIGSGRLIVSWDINAWADYRVDWQNGQISTTTFALIQNIYDLMDGSKQYGVEKKFDPEQLEIGDEGYCIITVNNIGNYGFENIIVDDTLSSCLQYLRTEGTIQPTMSPASGTSGGVLQWKIEYMNPREKKEIKFKFKVLDTECN